jgi:hypothetical protein
LEEFNEIFDNLKVAEKSKVKTIMTNYQIGKEDFCDKWETIKYNIIKNIENKFNQLDNQVNVNQDIIIKFEEELQISG